MTGTHADARTIRLVELTRGGLVESCHRGALAVVSADSILLAAAGDPFLVTYMRSAAKPFQALPTVAAGVLEHFGLDEEALALICASHYGTEEHVRVAQRILEAIGLDHMALRCGIHWPLDQKAARRLAAMGQEPNPLHNNCSGKHAGMLALARFWGCDDADYTQPEHPVQQAILQRLSEMSGLSVDQIHYAPDGCTVPSFALPLAHAALAYARLMAPDAPPECQRVVAAMQRYPHLVSNRGALDDQLMRAGQGTLVSKGGAEGYQGVGIRAANGRAIGIALKIIDGSSRAKGVVIRSVLEALGLVDQATLDRLEALRRPPVTNRRNQVVGEMRPTFELVRFDPPLKVEMRSRVDAADSADHDLL